MKKQRVAAWYGVVLVLIASLALFGCGGGGGGGTPGAATYTVGGTVSGLTGAGLVLQNNSGDDKSIAANGAFTFATALTGSTSYTVTVKTQPANQTCVVSNGTGSVSAANVTNVAISCTTNSGVTTYTIGGTVSGLTGAGLVLRNNSGDDKSIAASGAFTFATGVANSGTYNVTVKTQPSSQTCTVASGSGAVAGANVTNVAITCAAGGGTSSGTHIYATGYHEIVGINDMTGAGWTTFGTTGTGVNQFGSSPRGIYADANGKIYVVDKDNNRIIRIDDMTGAGWVSLGSTGAGTNQFKGPTGITMDTAGKIYVADSGNYRIVRMDDMTGAGWTTLSINYLSGGIFVDATGKIYATTASSILRVDDMTGANRVNYTGATNTFSFPQGITVNAGKIYVADSCNNRIVRMDDMAGTGWTTLATNSYTGFGACGTQSIFVDSAGKIYVGDTQKGLVRFDGMTGAGETLIVDSVGTKGYNLTYGVFVR